MGQKIRYLDWNLGVGRWVDRMKMVKRVFSHLLIREDGDVDRALELLEFLGERHGLFNHEFTFEDAKRELLKQRLIRHEGGQHALTPKGERFVRSESLSEIFSGLKKGGPGQHPTPHTGPGGERTAETRPYRYGDDPALINYTRSLQNAYASGATGAVFSEDDLEVYETENHVSVGTVLLVDISHSMILYGEDRITPAKRVALALTELTLTRFPRDAFHVVLFGDTAQEIPIRNLTYAGVGPYHTNTHAGLQLARRILMRQKRSNKQIFMITDGKPTALMENNEVYLNPFGLDRKIVNKTLDEAAECRRHKIAITTFMLAQEPLLVEFVEKLTAINHGRAYFSSLGSLEQSVFVDYVRNRRRHTR